MLDRWFNQVAEKPQRSFWGLMAASWLFVKLMEQVL